MRHGWISLVFNGLFVVVTMKVGSEHMTLHALSPVQEEGIQLLAQSPSGQRRRLRKEFLPQEK
jgi:hypothetical protein